MTVGTPGDLVLFREQYPPVKAEIRKRSLLENEDVPGVQAVVVVGPEGRQSLLVVERAGHDVPGADSTIPARYRGNRLGEDAKERLVLDRADREVALGSVEAEPCALAAGDHEGRHLAAGDSLRS